MTYGSETYILILSPPYMKNNPIDGHLTVCLILGEWDAQAEDIPLPCLITRCYTYSLCFHDCWYDYKIACIQYLKTYHCYCTFWLLFGFGFDATIQRVIVIILATIPLHLRRQLGMCCLQLNVLTATKAIQTYHPFVILSIILQFIEIWLILVVHFIISYNITSCNTSKEELVVSPIQPRVM